MAIPAFVLRRIGLLIVVLIAVSILTFGIVNVLPGDVANAVLGDLATPAQIVAVRQRMGLDQPLLTTLPALGGWHPAGQFRRIPAARPADRADAVRQARQFGDPWGAVSC